jgi:galactokinase
VDAAWPPVRSEQWSDYVAGVAALWTGAPLDGGLEVAVASDVPLSSGVSSSAALEVATAFALASLTGSRASARDLAELAWRAETEFVGVPCGRLDQFGSALAPRGAALLIDCRTYEMNPVPVELDLVLADSGETHSLRSSAYAERRAECDEALRILQADIPALGALVDVPPARLAALAATLPERLGRRVRHVVNENQRAVLAARALGSGDHAAFGLLVNASHASLRDLYECSTPRLDAIAAGARALPAVLGARMMGAGWGGCVLIATSRGAGGVVADRLAADKALALPAVRVALPGAGAGER